MRLSFTSVLALALIGTSIGCGGKGDSTTSGTPAPTGEPAASGSSEIDGTYLIIETQIFGKRSPPEELAKDPEETRTVVIKGNTMTDLFGRKGKSTTIQLNTSKTPHEIDIFDPKEGESKATHGIYKVEGDKLTLVLGGEKPEERPKDFDSAGKYVVFVMTKKK